MSNTNTGTHFAPELHIPKGTTDISFYQRLGATEHFRFANEDGSIHVAEFDLHGAVFHLHEIMHGSRDLEPVQAGGVTAIIGLFVPDVHATMQQAIAAGAEEISPATDYDYGYRQGMFRDPFGHYWQIQKRI